MCRKALYITTDGAHFDLSAESDGVCSHTVALPACNAQTSLSYGHEGDTIPYNNSVTKRNETVKEIQFLSMCPFFALTGPTKPETTSEVSMLISFFLLSSSVCLLSYWKYFNTCFSRKQWQRSVKDVKNTKAKQLHWRKISEECCRSSMICTLTIHLRVESTQMEVLSSVSDISLCSVTM